MKHLFFSALVILAMASCSSSDTSSYCPTWKGFTVKRGNTADNLSTVSPYNLSFSKGDYVQITACQDKKGHLIHATQYNWILCCDTLLDAATNTYVHAQIYYTQSTNYDGYDTGADDPTVLLQLNPHIKTTGVGEKDTIKFVAKYMYSGQGVQVDNGSIVNNTSYGGHITAQSGSLSGGATGYLYFEVQ